MKRVKKTKVKKETVYIPARETLEDMLTEAHLLVGEIVLCLPDLTRSDVRKIHKLTKKLYSKRLSADQEPNDEC